MNNSFRFGVRDLFFAVFVSSILIGWALDKISTQVEMRAINGQLVNAKQSIKLAESQLNNQASQIDSLEQALQHAKNAPDKPPSD